MSKIQTYYTTDNYIAVVWQNGRETGTIEANILPFENELVWYIARALINPPKSRNNGIGSKLMTEFKKTIIKNSNTKKCIVTPGGYSDNKEEQFNFYLKNGFTKLTDEILQLIL
jgi:predicted N-acetyltransferase YhbS